VPGPAGDDFGRPVTTSGPRWRLVSRHRPAQLVTGGPNSSPQCAGSAASGQRRVGGAAGPGVDAPRVIGSAGRARRRPAVP